MLASKKPDLDEATLRIAQRMLNTPPKPHDEMKIGKSKAKRVTGGKPKKQVQKF
jgi:hypothetical protein